MALEEAKVKGNRLTHLLACLGEECGEVQQIIGKSIRFGLDSYNPNDAYRETNIDMLHREVNDVIAVYEMLCNEYGVDSSPQLLDIEQKKKKVEFYYNKFHGIS